MTRQQIDRAVELAKVMTHPARLEILQRASASPDGVAAGTIYKEIGRSESGTRFHFVEMAKAGVLRIADVQPVRGTVRKNYAITPLGEEILEWVAVIPDPKGS